MPEHPEITNHSFVGQHNVRNFSGAHWIQRGVALVLIVVFAPLLALIALFIKATSHGPVLFRQDRIGQHGKRIRVYKFRTMYMDAESAEIRQYSVKSDPRITRVGSVLRRLSLDELPQIFNVLRGEMALVGPRSALPFEVSRFTEEQMLRFSVLPGITGLWQVSGRPATDFAAMAELDLQYVQRRNFWLDLTILFRTFRIVVTARGAY